MACSQKGRLSQTTLKVILSDYGITNFFDSLEDNEWEIVSFEEITANVCVKILASNVLLSVTLPKTPTN